MTPAMEIEVRLFNSLRKYRLRQGDILASSGPVPFSHAYGAPVVSRGTFTTEEAEVRREFRVAAGRAFKNWKSLCSL